MLISSLSSHTELSISNQATRTLILGTLFILGHKLQALCSSWANCQGQRPCGGFEAVCSTALFVYKKPICCSYVLNSYGIQGPLPDPADHQLPSRTPHSWRTLNCFDMPLGNCPLRFTQEFGPHQFSTQDPPIPLPCDSAQPSIPMGYYGVSVSLGIPDPFSFTPEPRPYWFPAEWQTLSQELPQFPIRYQAVLISPLDASLPIPNGFQKNICLGCP